MNSKEPGSTGVTEPAEVMGPTGPGPTGLPLELQKYHDMGLILVPLTIVQGNKTPLISYKHYKDTGQSLQDLEALYDRYKGTKPLQWAVYAVHPIVNLDWDTAHDYEAYFSDVNTLTFTSPSGGYHSVLTTLVPAKPFKHLGLEYKPGELCTIIGEGYSIIKDSPIKEIPDLEELLKKKLPGFKIYKDGKNFPLIDVLDRLDLFPDRVKGRKEDWHTDCPLCGAKKAEKTHFYYYHDTNSWYCHKCGRGGNAVNFVMALKDINGKEAVAYIQELLGLTLSDEDKDAEENVLYKTTVRLNNILYEQVTTKDGYKFVSFNGSVFKYHDELTDNNNDTKYHPCADEEVLKGLVVLPNAPADYGTVTELLNRIDKFIYKWLDITDTERRCLCYYILQTWVYENFHTIGYARALGDFGSGKTRYIDTIGLLCYKPMVMVGAVGSAPVFRIMDKYRGTLIIDKANFGYTEEAAAITKILNAGFEKGKLIPRCDKENPDSIRVFDPFCPKVLGTRKPFGDTALESRCYTSVLTKTDREDIPVNLNDAFFKEKDELVSQLLAFRLKNINDIRPDETLQKDFIGVDSRIIQRALPLAAIVHNDPEAYKEFIEWVRSSQEDLIEDRQGSWEGTVVLAILDLYEAGLPEKDGNLADLNSILISAENIAAKINENIKSDKYKVSSQKVGKMLRTLKFSRKVRDEKNTLVTVQEKRTQKRALVTDPKLLLKLLCSYTFFDEKSYSKLRGIVSSVTSAYGDGEKLKKGDNTVTESSRIATKTEKQTELHGYVTLVELVTEKGRIWEEYNQQSINSSNIAEFVQWYCHNNNNGNGNTPEEIREIAEKIFAVTPDTPDTKPKTTDTDTAVTVDTNNADNADTADATTASIITTIEVNGEISEVVVE